MIMIVSMVIAIYLVAHNKHSVHACDIRTYMLTKVTY